MSKDTEQIHHRVRAVGWARVGVQPFVALVAVVLALGCASSGEQAAQEAPTGGAAFLSDISRAPEVIVTACYDCHSKQTDAVWNAKLAPSYWFAGPARKDLSFTDWSSYDREKQAEELRAIAKEVRDGGMPPWDYTLLHPAAKLTEAEKSAIVQWASAAAPNAPE